MTQALRRIGEDTRVNVRMAAAYVAARLKLFARSSSVLEAAVQIDATMAEDKNAVISVQREVGRLQAEREHRRDLRERHGQGQGQGQGQAEPPPGVGPQSGYTSVVATKSIVDVATQLAEAHRKEDPSTKAIFLAEDPAEVRLVEVSGSVASTGEVLPFRFAPRPDLGVPYASVVVLLSEEDWARLAQGELVLPPSWGMPEDLKKIA